MSGSAATGRNPLLRACNGCLATDRWLTRSTSKPKNNRPETEDEKSRRASALKVKEELKKKSPEARAAWYAEQKATRAQEDQCKKRTFSTAVGSVEDLREKGSLSDDLERYITFKQWASTELTLRTYSNVAEARLAWDKKIKDPTSKTMVKNGETLLYEFAGVEMRARSAHVLRAGLRQRMDIGCQDDLDEYQEESENRMKRARQRLEIETAANLEAGGGSENEACAPADSVEGLGPAQRAGGEQRPGTARPGPADPAEQASGGRAEEAGASQPAEEPAPGEACVRGCSKEGRAVNECLTSIETEARKTLEAESEDLKKDEKAERVSAMEDLVQQMEENIASKEKEWAAQNESSSAEALVQAREELAQYMKQYHTKDQKVQDVKTKIADLRTWHVKTKRSINEREKAAQKTAANKKIAAVSGNSGLELLSSSLCGLTSMAACGNVDYSFSVAHVLKRSSPTVFETARGQTLLSTVLGMEYYRLQKSWVQEKMKASQSNSCSAVVSKKPVQKRLAEILKKLG